MGELNDLGLKYQTDKSTITHHYLDTYEKYLAPWRDKEFVMWEIGVAGGASLKMWREYLPKARVIGIDINPDCAQFGDVFIGNQTDLAFLDNVMEQTGVPDIVLDDGSHYGPDMITTFKHLFPKLKSDSLMIIEDFHCAYDQTYGLAPPYGQGMSEVYKFFSGLDAHVDVMGKGMCGNQDFCVNHPSTEIPVPEFSPMLKSIHIYTSMRIFVRK